jgi:hypothetical protein
MTELVSMAPGMIVAAAARLNLHADFIQIDIVFLLYVFLRSPVPPWGAARRSFMICG